MAIKSVGLKMKYLKLFGLFLLFSSPCFSQTKNITVDSTTGKFINPTPSLIIGGNSLLTASSIGVGLNISGNLINLNSSQNFTGSVSIGNLTTGQYTAINGIVPISDINLPLQLSTGGANTQANIGINKNGSYGFLLGYLNNTATGGPLGNATVGYMRQVTSDPFIFEMNNTLCCSVWDASGNVGLGGTISTLTFPFSGASINISATGNINIKNAINLSSTQTTVNGSTSGTAIFSEPFQGNSKKEIIIYCSSLLGIASYTFPVAFSHTPSVIGTDDISTSIVTSKNTTSITLTGSTSTGFLELVGF